jgi:agmatinase
MPLPFAGIATFARAPHAPLDATGRPTPPCSACPFDIAVGFRPGQRFAPRAVREASLRYALPPEGFYDLRTGRARLAGVALRDAGDVDLPSLEPELARERITEAARALRARARLPVFLGGDHSVSYPLLRAFDDVRGLQVVQLDAHLDFTDARNDTRYSNSSPFRRAADALPDLAGVTTLGLRGLRFDREAVEAARGRGHRLVPMWELGTPAELDAAVAALPEGAPVYLSIDVDALDPGRAPRHVEPRARRAHLRRARRARARRGAAQHGRRRGRGRVPPLADPSGNSALLVARLVMDVLAAALDP